jgi:hypothetical protein
MNEQDDIEARTAPEAGANPALSYEPAPSGGTMVEMGPYGEWLLEPLPAEGEAPVHPNSRAHRTMVRDRVGRLRPQMAYASGTHPGYVLHCAIARAVGLHPSTPGLAAAIATRIGLSKQHYFRLVTSGGAESVINAATRLGYYAVARPPGESGLVRWIVGDMPIEVG